MDAAEHLPELEVAPERFSEAKVNDLQAKLLSVNRVYHNVVWFDVSVCNFLLMKEVQEVE